MRQPVFTSEYFRNASIGRTLRSLGMSSNFRLGVWRSEIPLSNTAAAKQYAALSEGPEDSIGFDSAVYAFHSQLTDLYPRLDMLSESDEERSPWGSSPEFSGVYVSIALRPTHYAEVFPMILRIAEVNGLVCFDPQNVKVHLPSCLEGKGKDRRARE
jgi:hypothetical protein